MYKTHLNFFRCVNLHEIAFACAKSSSRVLECFVIERFMSETTTKKLKQSLEITTGWIETTTGLGCHHIRFTSDP